MKQLSRLSPSRKPTVRCTRSPRYLALDDRPVIDTHAEEPGARSSKVVASWYSTAVVEERIVSPLATPAAIVCEVISDAPGASNGSIRLEVSVPYFAGV